jgi:hypothetical protein
MFFQFFYFLWVDLEQFNKTKHIFKGTSFFLLFNKQVSLSLPFQQFFKKILEAKLAKDQNSVRVQTYTEKFALAIALLKTFMFLLYRTAVSI